MIAAWRGLALAAAAILFAAGAAAAEPRRVALVRPALADPAATEAATRIQAELLAAGFAVVIVDEDPSRDASVAAGLARAAATVVVVRTDHGAAADVWVADRASRATVVRRVDTGASGEPSRPADLAIRAVELLRASFAAGGDPQRVPTVSPPPPSRPPDALPDLAHGAEDPADSARAADVEPASPRRKAPPRALFERFTTELGLTTIYGLGDTSGRLAPTLRFAYGAATGVAGRLTMMGPTSTDQAALVEVAYGFDRSWRVLAPVASLGAGASHTHLDDTVTAKRPALRTEAWAGVLAASAGVAARATDRAAFVIDAHALLVEPGPGAIVGMAPAGGKPQLVVTASLGVLAGF